MTTFADLGLSPELMNAVADAGYTTPTPIQAQAIPYVLMGRDVLGCAQTGTGKTASFTLPLIDILAGGRAKARMPRTLILEPTRELAAQVSQSFETYGKYSKLSMALLIGGESFSDQERKLDRGVDVLIATPGRLIDLFERGKILMSDVRVLVIDEADRMLDMGFIPDIERIVALLPRIRQTLFFSATMPAEIRRLADAFLMNPKEVTVAPPASTAVNVTQSVTVLWPDDKRGALRHLLETEDVKNALIFCNRKRDVDILAQSLQRHNFDAIALHGDMPQSKRTETLEKFKSGNVRILVASDVAARGLDVAGLSHVFNFDVPIHPDDYVHRIGRTGRAGNLGRAFTIATPDEGKALAAIIKLIGKDIPVMTIDGFEHPELSYEDARRGRGRSGKPSERPRRDKPPQAEAGARKPREERKPREDFVAQEERKSPVLPGEAKEQRAARGRKPREGRAERPAAEPIRQQNEPIMMGRTAVVVPISTARNELEDDNRIIGFGDHLPAFLSRPVRHAARR